MATERVIREKRGIGFRGLRMGVEVGNNRYRIALIVIGSVEEEELFVTSLQLPAPSSTFPLHT